MKLVTALAAFLLLLSSALASAAVDCEPARCAVQQAVNDECPCAGTCVGGTNDRAACTVASECPGGTCGPTNHGQHVSCVAHVVKRLAREGAIPTNCKGKIKRCAARSTCGKPGFVTCTVPTDTCDLATGTCTGDPTVACTVDADCGTKCTTKRDASLCPVGGVVGSGTCCASCN